MTFRKTIRGVWKSLTLNQRWRMERHVQYLKEHIDINDEVDAQNAKLIYQSFNATARRHQFISWVRNFALLLLYISIVAAYAQAISPFIADAISFLSEAANLIGFGVLAIIVLYLQRLLAIKMTDMLCEHAHLIAIYAKHNNSFVVHPQYTHGLFKEYAERED